MQSSFSNLYLALIFHKNAVLKTYKAALLAKAILHFADYFKGYVSIHYSVLL